MDLYDLLVMEALSGIGNGLIYPRENQQSEENLRTPLYCNLRNAIQLPGYAELFSYGQEDGSIISLNTPKEFNEIVNYANNLLQQHYQINDNIATTHFKPDLLIHNYNNFTHQHIIIEIKVGSKYKEFKKDICKLLGYINILSYRKAYLVFSFRQPKRGTVNQKINGILSRLLPREMPTEGVDKLFLIFPTHINDEMNIWTCVPFRDLLKVIQN